MADEVADVWRICGGNSWRLIIKGGGSVADSGGCVADVTNEWRKCGGCMADVTVSGGCHIYVADVWRKMAEDGRKPFHTEKNV